MARRTPKSGTPLNEKQAELAREERQLRVKIERMEREIADAPRKAEEQHKREREELLTRAGSDGSRLDVSIALNDKRYGDGGGYARRRVPLRKERREGRIIFLVLVIALAAAVLWLMMHLPF